MGQKLLGYDIIDKLGEGAGSVIFSASDPATGRHVALKHVVRDAQKDIRFVEQMETEFEISRQFNHPNLRRTYELKINKTLLMKVNEAFLIMELFEGTPLDQNPPRTTLECLDVFIQVAQGLRYMHQLGYVHCDLKPNNILRSNSGMVKVIDYGQSCKIGTIKERIQGTPDYIAPEQVDRKPIGVQTDVYNLGATLYWALTGRNIPTKYTVNRKGENSFLVDDRIDTPSQLNPKVPEPVSKLVMECIATRISKRPADMDQVITRLELGRHVLLKAANPQAFSVELTAQDLYDSGVGLPASGQEGIPKDPNRVEVDEVKELTYWSKALGVATDDLLAAVEKVGPKLTDVRKHLKL
jgi:eukaryotic-like serine/threonine-protein kinase